MMLIYFVSKPIRQGNTQMTRQTRPSRRRFGRAVERLNILVYDQMQYV